MNTDPRDLPTIRQSAIRYLRDIHDASPQDTTPALRGLANDLVSARAHFSNSDDGTPDWAGRSHAYRTWVSEIYDTVPIAPDCLPTVKASARYHVGGILRERLDEDTLTRAGLAPASPRTRAREHRRRRSTALQALSSLDTDSGALLSLAAASALLQRVGPEGLSQADDRGLAVAAEIVADLQRQTAEIREHVERGRR